MRNLILRTFPLPRTFDLTSTGHVHLFEQQVMCSSVSVEVLGWTGQAVAPCLTAESRTVSLIGELKL